jgi:signal recognition particle receptor subunit beta
MAILDDDNKSVVVRIAYAGPAMSGKTESVRSLATALMGKERAREKVFTPSEVQGRTIYFDWMDYSAGLFHGRQVRCQIVSVPGQQTLLIRRKIIVQSADAIIFVLDSSPEGMEESVQSFEEIRSWINITDDEPPVGILIQANKRDLDDALSIEVIKDRIQADENIGFIESVATRGIGIRESFVISVGLALDRTLSLMESDQIVKGIPEIETGEQMLDQMLDQEQEEAIVVPIGEVTVPDLSSTELGQTLHHMLNPAEATSSPIETLSAQVASVSSEEEARAVYAEIVANEGHAEAEIIDLFESSQTITIPTTRVPAGFVWPTVIGRILLNEVNSAGQILSKKDDRGWLVECAGGYRLRTEEEDEFPIMEQGRELLLKQISRHMSIRNILPHRRCLVLAETEENKWRLWQIVEAKNTLAAELVRALAEKEPEIIASKTLNVALILLQAILKFAEQEITILAELQTTVFQHDRPVYVGFVPAGGTARPAIKKWPFSRPPLKLVEEDFRPIISDVLSQDKMDVTGVLRHLEQLTSADHKGHNLAEMLSYLFLGH